MRFKNWCTATKWIKKNIPIKDIENYYFSSNDQYLKRKVVDRRGKFNKYSYI
jgi:formylmethanofuran dehydrogenase subunit E-like metal-binding protein